MVSSDILNKAKKYCAYQERSQQEVRDKLYSLGLHKSDVEETLALLVTEDYVNEQRFAVAYVGGKFRIKKWGKIKIKQGLKQKKVSDYCIRYALNSISFGDYRKCISEIISEKNARVTEKDMVKRKAKIARQVISRGFEPTLVWDLLNDAD